MSVLKLDLVTDSLSYTLKTPEWSKDYNWGGAMNYNFWDYDKNKDQLVVGFNNNSKVYIATFNSGQIELSNYFITNSDFFEEIIPYAEIGKRSTLKNAQNYFLAYPRYYFTLFDPFRNLYYRLAMHPLTNDEISSGETRMNTSLLIYDEEFEKNWRISN